MNPPVTLYDKVIAASGLSEVFARGTIKRACSRVGVNAETMTPSELGRALPSIEQALAVFLPADQKDSRMQAIKALSRG
ncbi:MAG TPA: hypothetical protein PKA58_17490 [Polyangium sp.]|jgi:hypothetical protein|nr:hypothetical protein [Polyangium sp.]